MCRRCAEKFAEFVRNESTVAEKNLNQHIQRLKLKFQHTQYISYIISAHLTHFLTKCSAYICSHLDSGWKIFHVSCNKLTRLFVIFQCFLSKYCNVNGRLAKRAYSHNSSPYHSSLDFSFKILRSFTIDKQKTMHNLYHDPSRKNLARLTSVLHYSKEAKICFKMYQQTTDKTRKKQQTLWTSRNTFFIKF